MTTVGLRELGQNASAVLKQVENGTVVTVTDHRRPVANIVPLQGNALDQLRAAGLVRPPLTAWKDVPPPFKASESVPKPSEILRVMREAERY